MTQIRLEEDGEHLLPIALGFYEAGTIALRDLAIAHRGDGPWFEILRAEAKRSMRAAIPEGIPIEKEAAFIEAGMRAVDLVFDRISFRDK